MIMRSGSPSYLPDMTSLSRLDPDTEASTRFFARCLFKIVVVFLLDTGIVNKVYYLRLRPAICWKSQFYLQRESHNLISSVSCTVEGETLIWASFPWRTQVLAGGNHAVVVTATRLQYNPPNAYRLWYAFMGVSATAGWVVSVYSWFSFRCQYR